VGKKKKKSPATMKSEWACDDSAPSAKDRLDKRWALASWFAGGNGPENGDAEKGGCETTKGGHQPMTVSHKEIKG